MNSWISKWMADVICFQETKINFVSHSIVNSLWNFRWVGWVEFVLNGASEDILVMQDRRMVELVDNYVGNFLVACHFKSVDDGVEWVLQVFMVLM